jgi:hypothetical protein
MKMIPRTPLIVGLGLALSGASASAQIAYSDNFDAGISGGSWTAKLSAADAVANFAYNYGAIGIPSAPHSTGGTTIGMNFVVNQSAGVFQGISATPNGQSFAGDFTLRFDMWLNYVGPLGVGGSGSTQLGSFGWGVDGTTAQWAGGSSGVMLAASLDGGSAQDYRLYKNGANDATLATYAAGSQNNSAAYYTGLFPAVSAPAAQLGLYPGQTGSTDPGEVAFKWYDVSVQRIGNTISWTIDGNLIASSSLTGVSLSGANIFFGIFDSNATSSTDANDFLNTAIFDNVVVTVPEPSSLALASIGGLVLLALRRRK